MLSKQNIVTSGLFSQNKELSNILRAFLIKQLFHSHLLDMR